MVRSTNIGVVFFSSNLKIIFCEETSSCSNNKLMTRFSFLGLSSFRKDANTNHNLKYDK